jgi:hypothetical protein
MGFLELQNRKGLREKVLELQILQGLARELLASQNLRPLRFMSPHRAKEYHSGYPKSSSIYQDELSPWESEYRAEVPILSGNGCRKGWGTRPPARRPEHPPLHVHLASLVVHSRAWLGPRLFRRSYCPPLMAFVDS